MKRLLTLGLLAAIASAGGCIGIGGSDRCYHTEPTLGRQLTDLKDTFDRGVISADEYATAKSRLIRGGHGD